MHWLRHKIEVTCEIRICSKLHVRIVEYHILWMHWRRFKIGATCEILVCSKLHVGISISWIDGKSHWKREVASREDGLKDGS